MLSRSEEAGHPCAAPDLRGNIHPSSWSMWAVWFSFHQSPLSCWEKSLPCLDSGLSLSHTRTKCWILSSVSTSSVKALLVGAFKLEFLELLNGLTTSIIKFPFCLQQHLSILCDSHVATLVFMGAVCTRMFFSSSSFQIIWMLEWHGDPPLPPAKKGTNSNFPSLIITLNHLNLLPSIP